MSFELFQTQLVGRGWFMPGMSCVIFPITFIAKKLHLNTNETITISRYIIGFLNFFLNIWIVSLSIKSFSKKSQIACLYFLTLTPILLIQSFTFWGELLATKIIIILILSMQTGKTNLKISKLLTMGITTCFIVYLKPSFILILPVFTFFLFFKVYSQENWIQATIKSTLFLVSFTALLSPWSASISKVLGAKTLTTSSIKLNTIVAFNQKILSETKKESNKNIWGALHQRITKEAREEQSSYGKKLNDHFHQTLKSFDTNYYQKQTKYYFKKMFFQPSQFLDKHFNGQLTNRINTSTIKQLSRLFKMTNTFIFIFLSTYFLYSIFAVPIRSYAFPEVSSLLLLHVLTVYIQPFLSIAHGRYYSAAIISVGYLLFLPHNESSYVKMPIKIIFYALRTFITITLILVTL